MKKEKELGNITDSNSNKNGFLKELLAGFLSFFANTEVEGLQENSESKIDHAAEKGVISYNVQRELRKAMKEAINTGNQLFDKEYRNGRNLVAKVATPRPEPKRVRAQKSRTENDPRTREEQ